MSNDDDDGVVDEPALADASNSWEVSRSTVLFDKFIVDSGDGNDSDELVDNDCSEPAFKTGIAAVTSSEEQGVRIVVVDDRRGTVFVIEDVANEVDCSSDIEDDSSGADSDNTCISAHT